MEKSSLKKSRGFFAQQSRLHEQLKNPQRKRAIQRERLARKVMKRLAKNPQSTPNVVEVVLPPLTAHPNVNEENCAATSELSHMNTYLADEFKGQALSSE